MNEILPKIFALALFFSILILTWITPKEKLNLEFSNPLKDLRIWASLLIAIQTVLYILF